MEKKGNSQLHWNESTEEKKEDSKEIKWELPFQKKMLGSEWMGPDPKRKKIGSREETAIKGNM